jgi:hypothetical protein
MKRIKTHLKALLLLGFLFTFISYIGCNDDDEGDNVAAMLIGTWTITDAEIDSDIGGMSVKDFFINVGGLSEIEAEAFSAIFDAIMGATFTGTLQIKDDNTYISNFGGEIDDGTWSLNSDGDVLIIDGGTVDEMVINIISITSTTLVVTTDTEEFVDIDDEPLTPDVEVNLSVQLTLTK